MRLVWKRGLLKYKLLPHQHELFHIFANTTSLKTVVNASRRYGKSTVAILYAIIFGLLNPDSQIKIATKTQKSLKKTFNPILRLIFEDMPKDLIKWSAKEDCYQFYNGSQLHIHGTDMQRHEGLRGQKCDLGIIDEAAFCSDLRYIVQSILLPQTIDSVGNNRGRLILLSTPEQKASSSGEEFKSFCLEAQLKGAYYTKDIYSNTSLSKELIEEYKNECGGEDSIEWQVEYLCRFKIDPEKAIVPEWRSDKMVLSDKFNPEDNKLFNWYHKYTCLDLGVKRDFTVGLCGYYDFSEATLYVLNEFYVKNTTTPKIAEMLKIAELEAFGDRPLYRRVCDSDNPQLVNDFVHLHHIGIGAVEKTSLEAMVNSMRVLIGLNQVKVHPRCQFLIRTLEHGTWSDSEAGKLKKDFARTKELGHMDAIAAIMYLIRSLNRSTNPVPATYGINLANTLIQNHNSESTNKQEFRKGFIGSGNRRRKSR